MVCICGRYAGVVPDMLSSHTNFFVFSFQFFFGVFFFVRKLFLNVFKSHSMSTSQVVPSKGENITAHSTLFTTEVDQRTDTAP